MEGDDKMTMDYISKALTKFNLLFIIYATVMLLFWGILLLNSELIIVPIAVSFFIVYLCVKKIPEYSFWIKILRFYNNSELEEFIDKEYNNIKNVKEYNEKNKKTLIT